MPRLRPLRGARSLLVVSIAVLALGGVSGCEPLSNENANGGQPAGSGLERSKVTVGTLPIVDAAAIHMAIKKGYFTNEGLEVELKTLPGGAVAIPGLANGELQFAFGNHVSFLAAKAKGILDIKLVADGYQARPGVFRIMVSSDSPITRPQDLAGKKIAINTKANIVELTTRSALEAVGVNMKTVTFVEIPFPDMQARLQRKDVDAAFMVEPFITQAELVTGVVALVDPVSGATNEIPIAGWAASAAFVKQNPKTAAAFQRAIVKGQQDCVNRTEVEELVTNYAKVDKQTASLLRVGTWPTTLEPTRLQRVADLMKTYGVLTQPVDITSMIFVPES